MFSHLGVDHSNPCGTNAAEWCQGARSRTSRPCSRWYHHARAQSSLLFLVRLRKNFLCFCNCPVCNSVELFGLYCFLSQFKVSYVDYFKSVHIAFTLTILTSAVFDKYCTVNMAFHMFHQLGIYTYLHLHNVNIRLRRFWKKIFEYDRNIFTLYIVTCEG